jgi:hypothetical protein
MLNGGLCREGRNFRTQLPDGIMGMSWHSSGRKSFVQSLSDSGRLSRKLFAMCMSLHGGALSVGAYDIKLHAIAEARQLEAPPNASASLSPNASASLAPNASASLAPNASASLAPATSPSVSPSAAPSPTPSPEPLTVPVQWVWLQPSGTTFYVVKVGSVAVGDTRLSASSAVLNRGTSGVIVDSGTTFSYLPREAFAEFETTVTRFCAADGARCAGNHRVTVQDEGLCFSITDPASLDATFPTVSITLQRAGSNDYFSHTVKPSSWLINMVSSALLPPSWGWRRNDGRCRPGIVGHTVRAFIPPVLAGC